MSFITSQILRQKNSNIEKCVLKMIDMRDFLRSFLYYHALRERAYSTLLFGALIVRFQTKDVCIQGG